jgi:hypothetical protein
MSALYSVFGVFTEHDFRLEYFARIYKVLNSGKFYPRCLWQRMLKAVFGEGHRPRDQSMLKAVYGEGYRPQ